MSIGRPTDPPEDGEALTGSDPAEVREFGAVIGDLDWLANRLGALETIPGCAAAAAQLRDQAAAMRRVVYELAVASDKARG